MALSGGLGAEVLPTSILFDAGGREVWRYVGDLDWTSPEAARLLGEAGAGAESRKQTSIDCGETERDQPEPDEILRREGLVEEVAPRRIATGGTSKVTSSALVAPEVSISRK